MAAIFIKEANTWMTNTQSKQQTLSGALLKNKLFK